MSTSDISILDNGYKQFQEELADFNRLYGLKLDDDTQIDKDHTIKISKHDDNTIQISTSGWKDIEESNKEFDSFLDACEFVDNLLDRLNQEVFCSVAFCNPFDTKSVVQAAITTRDLAKNLVRVKSSNVWAYSINIRDRKSKVGDVLTQFKGPNGGPGDIYLYYDVPVNLWRRWLAAPSKGHFFWQYIRNTFSYRKLTGDKRGKLPHAIN